MLVVLDTAIREPVASLPCDFHTTMNVECLTFQPVYMERIWGGRKLQTYFDRELPSKNPIGESWELVDREDIQSVVSEAEFRGVSLHELWVNHRHEIFGDGYDVPAFSDPGEDPGCL